MVDGVRTRGVCFAYGRGPGVLTDVDLDLPAGSLTAVIGPNGSGKSTLLQVLAGLLRPSTGSVEVAGLDVSVTRARARARRIAWLPQFEPADIPFSALELVLMGRFPWQGLLPFDRLEDLRRARACLERTGVSDLSGRLLRELSGGERQRVHLARALAQEPRCLLLDEPAASLDLRHQVETYRLLSRLQREEGRTVVLVSHDLNLPASHADHVVVLSAGRVHAVGPPGEMLRAKVLEPVYETSILETPGPGGTYLLHPRP